MQARRRSPNRETVVVAAVICLLMMEPWLWAGHAQTIKIDRERGQEMLKAIKEDLRRYYYDPRFHGMDLEARCKVAEGRVKNATSNGEIFRIIAQVLSELNDSHTNFLPPQRASRIDYGWRMQMIGESCFVTVVKPGSDAAAKGLKRGDLVHSVDGFIPTRENVWKFNYLYNILAPRTGIIVVIRGSNGELRELKIASKIREGEEVALERQAERKREDERLKAGTSLSLPRYHALGSDLMICKMPRFTITEEDVDKMMSKIRPYKNLILDLRGNSGGYETTLTRVVGYFFDRKVRIASLNERGRIKHMEASTRGEKGFNGRVIVLVDSNSASASELFARLVQLEKRGIVVGDRTAGAVMRAKTFSHSYARGMLDIKFSGYGASITVSDAVMADGESLEHTGVTPNEVLVPTARDLAKRHDPVLARAAALLGAQLDPEQAGMLFAIETETEADAEEEW